jgi:YVTN family beta-propeller protein
VPRPQRSARARRRALRGSRLVGGVLGVGLLVLLGWALLGSAGTSKRLSPAAQPSTTSRSGRRAQPPQRRRRALELRVRRTAALAAPLQDEAAAALNRSSVLLAGGLTAADTSSDRITVATAAGARLLGRLPVALHDSAAAALGGAVYLFGGGTGTTQLDQILRIDRSGRVTLAGRLPSPSSDQAAARIGDTAYVVGGYTGSHWLDTIVAYGARRGARVVAHLPTPLRYAAVAATGRRLVIAGGSLPSGNASRAVYTFTVDTGRVRRVAMLPDPTTHAAAAAIGNTVFVLGGRGATLDTPTGRIVAIDLPTGAVRAAGTLGQPVSDLAAVTTGGHVLLVGGHADSGAVATIAELAPKAVAAVTAARVGKSSRARDVYAADRAGLLTGAARFARPLVYVPNSRSDTVDVIDPRTYRVVAHFAVGLLPQHVVPAWDLRTLYVTNDIGNSLTTINPRNGKPGRTIPVDDPYNMYFTPDGRYAIVVAERLARLDFRDAHSFRLHHSLAVPCRGVDHIDFSADGSYLLASCEFSSQLVKVDVASEQVVGTLTLPRGGAPQDVKLSPDGRLFYVADMLAGGVWLTDGNTMRVVGFVHTGAGAHGLYPSRDARLLYVTNRSAGTISVISFRTRRVVATWTIPGGGSPDMGNVSADGRVLWLSGRYNAEVYAISTASGRLLARIPVGLGPHGLCVWPQPGRYSLGHTGILR